MFFCCFVFFIVAGWVGNKGNVIVISFRKARTFLLFLALMAVDIPVLSPYLIPRMPVMSERLSPLLPSLLSVLMRWLLPVAASLWGRHSPGIVYLKLAALPAERINRGRVWSISDWTGVTFAGPLSCTNSTGITRRSSLQAATPLPSNEI